MANDVVRVSQDAIEVFYTYTTPSPTTPTGAGVSQDLVEVFYSNLLTSAAVTQDVVEVFFALPATPLVHVTQDLVEVFFTRPGPA